MALDYLPSPGWAVIYGETPSATRWSELGDNDDALATGAGIDDNAIAARHLAVGAVKTRNLDIGQQDAFIFTDQTTTSTGYTDLATVGPQVTVTIGPSGKAMAIVSGGLYNAAAQKYIGVALSGANTVSPVDNESLRRDSAPFDTIGSRQLYWTGLTPGVTTFTMKYRTASGTANFFSRRLTVIPL